MSYIISYVGAGGKTSSIYQDAAAFVNEGKKVMITTTTHMYVPKDLVFIDGREKSCEKLREKVAGILKKKGICVCGTILSDNKKQRFMRLENVPETMLLKNSRRWNRRSLKL